MEVIDLGHVSEEDVLPVSQHRGQEDEHGRIIHLCSVALPDAKRAHHSAAISSKADEKGT